MPSIEEVCKTFSLTDVDIDYTDEELANIVTYKQYMAHIRPLLTKENPKVQFFNLFPMVRSIKFQF